MTRLFSSTRTARPGIVPRTLLFLLLLAPAGPLLAQADDDLLTPPPEAERHESGLVSLVMIPGTGMQPDANDLVAVHFTAYTPAGAVFRQTEDEAAEFALDKVFPGWREGISLMRVGETRRLWIPAELGPPNPTAGPQEAIFDVELKGVRRMPNPPETLRMPPEDATKLTSGVFTRTTKAGTPDGGSPTADGRVLLEYTTWDANGVSFDSTIPRGRPTAFQLDRVLPAFAQVVQGMTVGETIQMWIPRQVHAGQWPNAPKGMMIIEAKLLSILDNDMMSVGPEAAPGSVPQGSPVQSPVDALRSSSKTSDGAGR